MKVDKYDIQRIKSQRWDESLMKNMNENSNRYRRLNRGLQGDKSGKIRTFAIISPQNPLGWKNSDEEEFRKEYQRWLDSPSKYNKEKLSTIKTKELLHKIEDHGDKALRYSGAKYVPLYGSYGDKERSFMIFNITLSDAKTIARAYGQESFFFAIVSENGTQFAYYETDDSCKTYHLESSSEVFTDEDDANDFFSKFGKKFRINMKVFGDEVPEISDMSAFEESFDEDKTFMSRAISRRKSYKNNNTERELKESIDEKSKKEYLEEYLGVDVTESGYDENVFETDDGEEWLVVDEDEADERVRDYIEDSVWSFKPKFILKHMKGYNDIPMEDEGVIEEAIETVQEKLSERANPLILAIIEDFDKFVEDAVNADGMGSFISPYDGDEIELADDRGYIQFYAYRQN